MEALRIDRLSLGYGKKIVLSDISVPDIAPGTMVGVLGPNGVGKSSLLRALAGLLPHGGDFFLGGQSVRAMTHRRRAGLIGYLPQALPQETSLTAYEAVISACRAVCPDMPPPAVDSAAEEIFEILEIRALAFEALNELSGGQRQMVGLAQILVRKPRLLLLDEPTSALDLRWQLGVFGIVRRMIERNGGICLMALHDINLAMRHCDALVLLSDGGILAHGPPAQAMTRKNLKQAYRVDGHIELCSNGTPFVVTDGVLDRDAQSNGI